MAYTKTTWVNDSEPAINAANLNKIEQGIADAHAIVAEPGPKGDKGDTGAKGAKGDKGDKGDPGFPTEEQWNALVARVEALETPEAKTTKGVKCLALKSLLRRTICPWKRLALSASGG